MRAVSQDTMNAWLSGDYTGPRRAMVRATVAKLSMMTVPYKTQVFSTALFGQHDRPRELPNIKSLKWSRSVDQDAQTCTIELYNTEPLPLGHTPSTDGDFDLSGYYTYNRGKTSWSTSRWNQQANGWNDYIVPDRIIRTYEGYGFDDTVSPENDPHMYLSGVWLIDTVQYSSDGLITVTCRDLARLLLDQILYVPVVPFKHYPLHFTAGHNVANPNVVSVSGTTAWVRPTFSASSTTPYVGVNGLVFGHRGSDAFDTSTKTYWLSIGNGQPNADYAYEYIEGKIKSNVVSAVKFRPWGGPYRVYLSIYAGGKWQGDQTIPYNRNAAAAAPNGADIRYVTAFSCGDGDLTHHKLSKLYKGVTKIRLTFHHLYNSGIGQFPYRAGCRDFQVAVGGSTASTKPGGTRREGNYDDYTDIVKLFLAYGGFYWPKDAKRAVRMQNDGTLLVQPSATNDPYLKLGRVWSDQNIKAAHVAGIWPGGDLGVDVWDKKPIMDGINYIKDILGFVFFVDETGGPVWRLPNVWKIGCVDSATGLHTSKVITLDERTVLLGVQATLSSRNTREQIFVANLSGKVGAVAPQTQAQALLMNPYPSGMRRVGGWTDQRFASTKECQIMADMIMVQQMYSFRTDTITIAGCPALQLDDQVRIYERVTNEGYYHYISGIDSEWDAESGKWTYTLHTHWLGEQPYSNWVIDPSKLSPDTQTYLATLKAV